MHLRLKYFHQVVSLVAGLMAIAIVGMSESWSSPSLPILLNGTETITITNDEGSWLTVTLYFGGLFGGIFNITTSDSLGRKPTIIMSVVLLLLGWSIKSFATSLITLFIARFIIGIPILIIFATFPLYIGEIADPKIRGTLAAAHSFMYSLGSLSINTIGAFISIQKTALITCGLTIVSLAASFWMQESPYYLISKERNEEAKTILEKFRSGNVDEEFEHIKSAVEQQKRQRKSIFDLLRNESNIRAMFIILICFNSQLFNGTVCIVFYAELIFEVFGTTIPTKYFTIVYFTVTLFMNIICLSFSDRFGRRPILIVSVFFTMVLQLLIGLYLHFRNDLEIWQGFPALLFLALTIFSNLIVLMACVMHSEVLAIDIKVLASILCQIYYTLGVLIVGKLFEVFSNNFGMDVPFLCFAAASFVNLVLVVLFVPETRGKTLEEIQEQIRNKKLK